jgi:hypothetical protein
MSQHDRPGGADLGVRGPTFGVLWSMRTKDASNTRSVPTVDGEHRVVRADDRAKSTPSTDLVQPRPVTIELRGDHPVLITQPPVDLGGVSRPRDRCEFWRVKAATPPSWLDCHGVDRSVLDGAALPAGPKSTTAQDARRLVLVTTRTRRLKATSPARGCLGVRTRP